MKDKKIRMIAYMALYAALYWVLKYVGDLIPFLKMPNGGSIELELIALFLASFQLGYLFGIGTFAISFLLSVITGITTLYIVNFPQFLLDYILPLLVISIAYVFGHKTKKSQYISICIAMVLKYVFQVISGAYFWPANDAAGSLEAWIFSLNYNAWYNLATAIVCVIVVPILLERLKKARVTFIDA